MTRQSVRRIAIVPALLLVVAVAMSDAQQKGRYKKQGANCEWDANDTGPNQCTPVAKGRFKKDGDACRWDAVTPDGAAFAGWDAAGPDGVLVSVAVRRR